MTTTATCPVCGNPQAQGLLDDSCTTRLERDLADVRAIVADLQITISKQARVGNASGPSGLARERSPINVGAMNVADDLTNTLTTWARDVGGGSGFAGDLHPAELAAFTLLACIDLIRRHPAVNELVDEITDAITQARRAIDRPIDRQFVGPCLVPGQDDDAPCLAELYARHGASHAICRQCGITHDVGERRAWLMRQAQDLIVTVKEASSYLGEVGDIRVSQASIRGYIHRGKLAYRPGSIHGIRLGDLLTVVLDEGERKSA